MILREVQKQEGNMRETYYSDTCANDEVAYPVHLVSLEYCVKTQIIEMIIVRFSMHQFDFLILVFEYLPVRYNKFTF